MINLTSDLYTSENKKEGMKFISQSVYNFLKINKECTYQQIVNSINTKNMETKIRRIYDVLNVLRAVNVVGKKGKIYYLIDNKDNLVKRKTERDKLLNMKESFEFITNRNSLLNTSPDSQKLHLPFMIVFTDKESEIHCDTNEERSYFNFKSNRPLKVIEDLEILNKMRENFNNIKETSLNMDSFIF